MKKILTILLFLICSICQGQNLIPNGDFEEYWGCPFYVSDIDSTKFWFEPTEGTADYYHQCAAAVVNIPNTWVGYQPAMSGIAFAGLQWVDVLLPGYREYLEIEIDTANTSGLIQNECYYFEMYVNLGNNSRYTCSNIGIYFSDTLVNGITNYLPLPFVPQISNAPGNFPDSLNWSLISGNYTATGGEKYLIIGNFDADSVMNLVIVDSSSSYAASYIFIDDVSLTLCSANAVTDFADKQVSVFPNPVSTFLNVSTNTTDLTEIKLFDITSRIVFQQSFTNSISISTEHLPNGLYFYEVRNELFVLEYGRFIKE